MAVNFYSSLTRPLLHSCIAHQLRDKGTKVPNIVIVDQNSWCEWCLYSIDQNGEIGLSLSGGIVVNSEGIVYLGVFPRPLVVSAIVEQSSALYSNENHTDMTNGLRFLCSKSNKISLLGSGDTTGELSIPRKNELENLRKVTDAYLPETLSFCGNHRREKIDGFIDRHLGVDGIVIKPICGRAGSGVYLFPPGIDSEVRQQINRKFSQPHFDIYGVSSNLLQQRIPSLYLDHDDPMIKREWNLRIFVANGFSIGRIVRIGDSGKAINGALGAQTIHVDDLLALVSDDHVYLCRSGINRAETAACQISEFIGTPLLGLDFIVDPSGRPWLIEINPGALGVDEFFSVGKSWDERRQFTLNLLEAWKISLERIHQCNEPNALMNGLIFDLGLKEKDYFDLALGRTADLFVEQLTKDCMETLMSDILVDLSKFEKNTAAKVVSIVAECIKCKFGHLEQLRFVLAIDSIPTSDTRNLVSDWLGQRTLVDVASWKVSERGIEDSEWGILGEYIHYLRPENILYYACKIHDLGMTIEAIRKLPTSYNFKSFDKFVMATDEQIHSALLSGEVKNLILEEHSHDFYAKYKTIWATVDFDFAEGISEMVGESEPSIW